MCEFGVSSFSGPNEPLHATAALLRFLLNLHGHGVGSGP